ncbi:hypothetical protein D3C75_995970 [compost metagenome]
MVDFTGYTAGGADGPIDVTPREIKLLRLLVEYRGKVLTRDRILDELWGQSLTERWIRISKTFGKN